MYACFFFFLFLILGVQDCSSACCQLPQFVKLQYLIPISDPFSPHRCFSLKKLTDQVGKNDSFNIQFSLWVASSNGLNSLVLVLLCFP